MGKYEYICQTLSSDKDITQIMEDLSQNLKKNTNDTILEIFDLFDKNKDKPKNTFVIQRLFELFNYYEASLASPNDITKILRKSIKLATTNELTSEALEKNWNALLAQLNSNSGKPNNQNIANVIYIFGFLNDWYLKTKKREFNLTQSASIAICALLEKLDNTAIQAEHLANLLFGLNNLVREQLNPFLKSELLNQLLELIPTIQNSNPNASAKAPDYINEIHIFHIITRIAPLLLKYKKIKLSNKTIDTLNKLLTLLTQRFPLKLKHLTELTDSLIVINETRKDFTLNPVSDFLATYLSELSSVIKKDSNCSNLDKLILQIATFTTETPKNDKAIENFLQLTSSLFKFLNQLNKNQCTFSLNTTSIDTLHLLIEKLKQLNVSETVILSYVKITEKILVGYHTHVSTFAFWQQSCSFSTKIHP